jgi:hypothetical protein
MSVAFQPAGASWDDEGFHRFRSRLAAADGIHLNSMAGYGGVLLWEDNPTLLQPLLTSPSDRGFISSEDSNTMLSRLSVIADQWSQLLASRGVSENTMDLESLPDDPETASLSYDLSQLRALIRGVEHCTLHGCALAYE